MIKKILFAAVFSGTAFAAQAQSAGFSITGTISPSPCTISLGGGGVNDYGRLTKESLHLSTFTGHYFVRDEKHMSVAVNCPAPTKFALAFADNRESSAFITKGSPGEVYFGLGTHNGESIGSARFRSGPGKLQIRTTVGGVLQTPAAWLMTTGVAGANSSWEGNVVNYYFRKNKSVAFVADANATAPDALTEVAGSVEVLMELNKSVVDTATSDIQLDGSGTVTLVML